MCSKATLIRHAEKSIEHRALEYSQLFGKRIDAKTLRALYQGRRITLQHARVRRGDPWAKVKEEQQAIIEDLNERVAIQLAKGYDIVFVDQCVYSMSSVGHKGKVWGPAGDPL